MSEEKAAVSEEDRMFARVFTGPDGTQALGVLRRLTVEAVLPPSATDAELRAREGARGLVKLIEGKVKRGMQ